MKWSVGVMPLCVLLVTMPTFGAAPIIRSTAQVSPQPEVNRAATTLSTEARLQLVERRMQALTDILMRLDRIQQEIQQLRGEVELQGHGLELLKKRQRDLYGDIDRRMMQLTAKPPSAAPTPSYLAPPASVVAPDVATEPAATPSSQPPGAASQPVNQVVLQGVPVKEISAPPSTAAAAIISSTPVVGAAPENTAAPVPGSDVVSPVIALPVTPAADPVLEQPVYKQAFDLLMQRRYDEAKQAFRAFLSQYPNGRLAANAQYWVGEASYVTRDFATALDEFTKVVQNFPTSTKVSDSLLKIAFIQYEQKQWVDARKTLESIVDQYASSTAARLALKRLDRMRIEGN